MAKIGIKELAKIAGVSTASASRALSNPSRVSKKMRDKVQAAALEIGYSPNRLGASLRTSKSGNIIAIIPDISDTFNSGVIQSLERAAADRGYSVLFGDTQGLRSRELVYGSMVKSRQADGIIVLSHRLPFEDRDLASEHFVLPPLVNSCEFAESSLIDTSTIPWVSIDNVQAGRDAVEHLLSLGHKKIAVITGDPESPSSQQRLEGYKAALENAGVELTADLIHEGEYTLEAGVRVTETILLAKNRPTAIFCMCDEMALGCIATLKRHGFSVPQDMSVVGFDDIRFAEYLSPTLTTIRQPVEEIGRTCANILLDIIDCEPLDNPKHILPHELMVRDSSARLR
ncbi:LacI family DNA-binding transcriptional regulator [Arenicella xantha]|uniref:LacI family transcriptional regulator n=1 Tax=Arenicella xantha TaxID=644221 RepID=A0A395JMN7_9GAMM|nr:LacI family DNA-binding transcriptional regulator [Arenicella xantha]RBP50864.1 LacI family transcriptional regulator [Arenicella xantha]